MLLLLTLQLAFADPCAFESVTNESANAANVEFAYDDDPDTWAAGSSFQVFMTLNNTSQDVESVGVEVGGATEFDYDLEVWYLTSEDQAIQFVDEVGTMPEGEHQGTWPADGPAVELMYALDVTDIESVDFQVTCEATPPSYHGGGGCGCDSDYQVAGQSAFLLFWLPLLGLRRRCR